MTSYRNFIVTHNNGETVATSKVIDAWSSTHTLAQARKMWLEQCYDAARAKYGPGAFTVCQQSDRIL